MKLKTIDVGDPGLEFIKARLSRGRTFSHAVLAAIDGCSWRVLTCLPEGVSFDESMAFDAGGKIAKFGNISPSERDLSEYYQPLENWLIEVVSNQLRSSQNGFCLLEEQLAQASDPGTNNFKTKTRSRGNELYFLVQKNATNEAIRIALREGYSWTRIGVVLDSDCEIDTLMDSNKPWPIDEINKAITCLFVEAYDGESNIVGFRSKRIENLG